MKKFIALSFAVMLLFAGATASAAKCKFQTDTENVFTGEKIRWTKWSTFSMTNSSVVHSAILEGDRKYLGLRIRSGWSSSTRPTKAQLDNTLRIPADAKLLLLMDDESIIEFHSENAVIGDADYSVTDAGGFNIGATAIVKYSLDSDAMTALGSKRIKKARMTVGDKDRNWEFGKKGSKKLMPEIECIQ